MHSFFFLLVCMYIFGIIVQSPYIFTLQDFSLLCKIIICILFIVIEEDYEDESDNEDKAETSSKARPTEKNSKARPTRKRGRSYILMILSYSAELFPYSKTSKDSNW